MGVHLSLDLANVMQEHIGRRHGISEKQLAGLQHRTRKIHLSLQRRRQSGGLVFYDLPYMRESVIEVMTYAAEQIGRFENFVHIAAGPAAVGARALHTALNHPFHNYFTSKDRGGYPRLFFLERTDPDTFSGLFDVLDVGETLFNIVCWSGGAPMRPRWPSIYQPHVKSRSPSPTGAGTGWQARASFLILLAALKKRLGKAWKQHVVFTADAGGGDWQAIARAERIKTFAVHPGLGECFAVLSPAGLLPAAFSGIDVHGVLHGAAQMEKACAGEDIFTNPAYLFGAALYLLHVRKGRSRTLMATAADSLGDLALWFRRLWEENVEQSFLALSTERLDRGGASSRRGRREQQKSAAGTANDPPRRVVTFLTLGKCRHQVPLSPELAGYESFRALGGKTANQVLQAEQRAISAWLARRGGQPHFTITLPALRPETVGEFVFMMEVAAVYAAELCS